jgi:DHA2 family multidrug resistance protein-like MFS transporter
MTPGAKASAREWVGLAAISLACMLYSMDLTILNLAVPAIAADLHPTASQLLWIIDIYGFMVAGFLMVMGALGDRFGRRLMLMIGAAVFGLMSVAAAFAQSAEQLIAARAFLGIAGATLAPSTLSLISNMFLDDRERTFAISMWIASFSVGAILGPLAGGIIIQQFWWGAAFLVAVPVMALLLVLGPLLLPEFRSDNPPRLDYLSALMSLAAVLPLIYGVKRAAETGPDAAAFTGIACGIVIGTLFVLRQHRLEEPLVDLKLFRLPAFSLSLAINMLALFFMFGAFVFFAQYLQLVAGLSVLEAGLWSLPGAIAFTITSFFNARLLQYFTNLQIFVGGLLLSAVGFAGLWFSHSLPAIVACMIVASVGFTPVIALTTAYVVGAVPKEKTGVASALSETAGELGGALGIAVLGSLATYLYRREMADVIDPVLAQGRSIGTSLAATVEAARSLPSEVAIHVLVSARAAFMSSYHITALTASAALALLALMAARVLRGSPAASH